LEPPDEAGTAIGDRVDLRQVGDKVRHARIGQRRQQTGDIDLREVKSGRGHDD
jgi:hypothetical protein